MTSCNELKQNKKSTFKRQFCPCCLINRLDMSTVKTETNKTIPSRKWATKYTEDLQES